jgi:cyclic pyranopterin phosphate synthase
MNALAPHPTKYSPLTDPFGRTITYLRVSVTDRCDFRCVYCMAEDMTFLPKADVLTLEELDRLCSAFVARGVRKLRLTGGEPLVRKNVMSLFRSLSRHLASGDLGELTLTTNGSQLSRFANELAGYGVKRINVSVDTLDPVKFRQATRWGDLNKVLEGIAAARAAGLRIKINAVALKGVNEGEIDELIRWAHGSGMDLTLIETMPLGEVGADRTDQYLPLAARFHHPPHPQFLRGLQPRAVDLHRDPVHVPRPERRRGPPGAAQGVGERRPPAGDDRSGHRPQAQGARLRHRPRTSAAGGRPPHERDRRLS